MNKWLILTLVCNLITIIAVNGQQEEYFGKIKHSFRVTQSILGQSSFDFLPNGHIVFCASDGTMALYIFDRDGKLQVDERYGGLDDDCRAVQYTKAGTIAIGGRANGQTFLGQERISSGGDGVVFTTDTKASTVIAVRRLCHNSVADCIVQSLTQDFVSEDFYVMYGGLFDASKRIIRLSATDLAFKSEELIGARFISALETQSIQPNLIALAAAAEGPWNGETSIGGDSDAAIATFGGGSTDVVNSVRYGGNGEESLFGVDVSEKGDSSFIVAVGSYSAAFDDLDYVGGSFDLLVSSWSFDLKTANWHFGNGTTESDGLDDVTLTGDDKFLIVGGYSAGHYASSPNYIGDHCLVLVLDAKTGEELDSVQFGPTSLDGISDPSCRITDIGTDPFYGDIVILALIEGNDPNWIDVEGQSTNEDFVLIRIENPNPDSDVPGANAVDWLKWALYIGGGLLGLGLIAGVALKVRSSDSSDTRDSKLSSLSLAQRKFNTPDDDDEVEGLYTSFKSATSDDSWVAAGGSKRTSGGPATTTTTTTAATTKSAGGSKRNSARKSGDSNRSGSKRTSRGSKRGSARASGGSKRGTSGGSKRGSQRVGGSKGSKGSRGGSSRRKQ